MAIPAADPTAPLGNTARACASEEAIQSSQRKKVPVTSYTKAVNREKNISIRLQQPTMTKLSESKEEPLSATPTK